MGAVGPLALNSADQQGMFAPDWAAISAASRQRRRDQFEEESLYQAGGGARVQQFVDPDYRAGDLPGSNIPPTVVPGPSLVMNDTAARQSDPFLSQASQSRGTYACCDGFDCCFTTSCSAFCVALVQQITQPRW
jgi:hypothetical protein